MRAVVLPGPNQELEVRDDVEVGAPGPGEVRIRIRASGVCRSDLALQHGYFPHPLPAVLGHEGAGEVVAVGPGVTGVDVGDHVIVSWVPPCGDCSLCLGGQPNLCMGITVAATATPHFVVGGRPAFGFAGTGTFAEEVVVPAASAIPIPKDVPMDVAALLGCGVMTGVGAAIKTARVQPGSSVIVFGCGGVGVSVIQGARIAGAAEIVAIDVAEPKLEVARRFGATHAGRPDQVAAISNELTAGHGFDYAFEVVGTPQTIRSAWDATRRGGTTIIVGMGRTDAFVRFSAFELFYSGKTLIGCLYGSADVRVDFHRLIRLWRGGKLDLEGMITRRIDLTDVKHAFAAMEAGEVVRSVIEL